LGGNFSAGLSMPLPTAADQDRKVSPSAAQRGEADQRGSRWACMADSLRDKEPKEAEIVLSST
jgi:hypothetical protein